MIRHQRLKMQFSYLHFETVPLFATENDCSLSIFSGQVIIAKIHPMLSFHVNPDQGTWRNWIPDSVGNPYIPSRFRGNSMRNPWTCDGLLECKNKTFLHSNGILMESQWNPERIVMESRRNLRIHDGTRDPVSPGSLIPIKMNTQYRRYLGSGKLSGKDGP